MNITRWEPFREMEDMLRQLQPQRAGGSAEHASRWRPTANISETDSEYLIKAELPEVSKEDIQVQVHDGVLTLRGERKFEKQAEESNALRVESFYGEFARSFALPEDVDSEGITAQCRDGVLRVHLPKAAQSKREPVTVEVK